MAVFRILLLICCAVMLANIGQAGAPPVVRLALSESPLQVVEIPLNDYLVGVLAGEVASDWPPEALKAQAVAARSYALYRLAHPRHQDYDLVAGTGDLAYRWLPAYDPAFREAVRATRGEALWWDDEVIPAFFHSCCGGVSEQASRVWRWAPDWPFYRTRPDPYCKACPGHNWEHALPKGELTLLLEMEGIASGTVDQIIPLKAHHESKRIQDVVIITDAETLQLPSNRFRGLLGFDRLRSSRFNIVELDEDLIFVGSGKGHGVGLCQWGAHAMAQQKKSYREILEFYYPGVALRRRY